jgi:hypothetical protein
MSDPFVHENLTEDAKNRALEIARSMSSEGSSINTKLLERVLSTPAEFNNYPLKSRQALFERIGVQPVMAATESKGGIGFGSLFDAIKTTKQEYQKEQKAEPATQATDLFGALSATKQEYEKQKNTQVMGDISQEAKLRETLVAGVPEVVKKDASGRVIEEPQQRKVRNVREFLMDAPVETALTLGTGAITAPFAAVEQLGSDIYGKITGKPNVGQDVFKARMQAGTYVPRTEAGKEMVQTVGKAFEATKLPPVLAPELTAVTAAGRLPPPKPEGKPKMSAKEYERTQATIQGTGKVFDPSLIYTMGQTFVPQFKQDPPGLPGLASVGAAGRRDPVAIRAAIDALPTELQNEVRNVPINRINLPALESHVQALNLPVPISLTRGQATGDLVALSNELNRRGELQNIAYRMGETNKALIENLSAIRDRAAPDLPGSKPSDFGQIVIDTYKGIDNDRRTIIGNLYKDLETAAGGNFPIDSRTFVNNADAQLSKKLKSEFVPPTIQRQLQAYRDGGRMDFEQFEALRTNLATEIRKAERAGDGNASMALSIIRDSLEDLPLTGEAAALKPLADAARTAARERFEALKRDPAYKAAVDDKVAPENFVETFVLSKGKGTEKNVQTMMDALGKGTDGQYAVAANIIEYLRSKSVDQQGNFSQAAYNKALKELDPKLQNIFDGATAQTLRDLGEVSRKVMAQPKGSFANNSNTFVAALADKLGKGAEQALNLAIPGASIGTAAAQVRARRAGRQFEEQSLEPLAGVKGKSNLIRDILSKKE